MGSSLDLVTGRVQVGTRGLRGLSRPRLGPEPVSPSFVQGSWSGVWELCLAGNHWLAVLGKLRALPDHTSEAIALHPPVPCNVITGHPGHAHATGVSDGPGKPSKAERGLLPASRRMSSSGRKWQGKGGQSFWPQGNERPGLSSPRRGCVDSEVRAVW